jgi:APA family basic amino acid/polyamine antiporter
VAGAVVLGLGATLGAGVFVGLAPAASIAGRWFLPAMALAALAALCSAFSTADQSRAYPEAGGGYAYIRNQLGPWPGRIGASAYLLGRAGIAAALAEMFATYAFPEQRTVVALLVLAAAAVLSAAGVRFGTRLSWVIAGTVVVVLALVVVVCFGVAPPETATVVPAGLPGTDDFSGFMGVAGLLFIAFSGFERITAPNRGEPVHSARTLRVAIPLLIGLALLTTLVVGAAAQHQLGPFRLALSPAPLRDALVAADGQWLVPAVQFGAIVAAVSTLTFVFAGMRRALGAMAETGDLPARLAAVGDARPPWPLDLIAGSAAAIALLLLSPTTALAVGACGTLFYYAFTNASARILLQEDRTWPMRTACVGLGLSVLLAMSAPVDALLITIVAMVAGTLLLGLCARIGVRRRAAASLGARLVPAAEGRTSDPRDSDFLA